MDSGKESDQEEKESESSYHLKSFFQTPDSSDNESEEFEEITIELNKLQVVEKEGGEISSRYLSDFEEISFLGAGGYGCVVLTKHKLDGALYAVKKIPIVESITSLEVLKREAQIMAMIYYKHVVRYHQVWIESKLFGIHKGDCIPGELDTSHEFSTEELASPCLYIQMEYCPRSLKDEFECQPKERRMRLFLQVLKAVALMHSKNLLHGDISRSNILLGSDDRARISDFGLSRIVDTENELTDPYSGGTVAYRAPEGGTSLKADIYSLGVLLFEAVGGFTTDSERCRAILDLKNGIVADSPDFYNSRKSFLFSMLSDDPRSRPSIWQVLQFVNKSLIDKIPS